MSENKVSLWSKDFVFIILVNFLVFVNHLMILSTFPFYIEYLGGNEAVSGAAVALFCVISVVCRPFVGWLLDTGKRRCILYIGLAGMALTPLGYFAFSTLALAFICRMVQGAALAFSNTSTATVATDIIPKLRFGEGMGMFGMATALATAFAPALGLNLMNYFGFKTLFLSAAGVILISIILFSLIKLPKTEKVKKPLNIKNMFDKDAIPASVVTVFFMFTYGAAESFVAKFAAEKNLISGGIFFIIMAVVLVITRCLTGKVTDKHGEEIFVYACNASMLVAFLLLGLCANNITYVVAACLAGFGFGGLEPALQSMAVSIAPPDRRGSANSTFLCAYDIGIGLGCAIAGVLISSFGYEEMFVIMSVFNILSIVIYLMIGRNHPSSFSRRIKLENTKK